MRTNYTIVIHGTQEAAEAIRNVVDGQPGSQSHLTERRNLGGDIAAWILIANIAGQALPHVLGFLKEYLRMKQLGRVKIGDIEIENPTEADMEKLRARF